MFSSGHLSNTGVYWRLAFIILVHTPYVLILLLPHSTNMALQKEVLVFSSIIKGHGFNKETWVPYSNGELTADVEKGNMFNRHNFAKEQRDSGSHPSHGSMMFLGFYQEKK